MKLNTVIWALATNLCVLSMGVANAQSSRPAEPISLEQQTVALAKDLAKQLLAEKSVVITVLTFTDMQDNPNELGVYLAERISGDLKHQDGLTVLDRKNFASIMKEHNLTAEGLMENPSDAKKLGGFKGVNALVVGKLISRDGNIELLATGISTDTAAYVASGNIKFPATKDLERMLHQSAAGGSPSRSQIDPQSVATASEGEAIAVREVGPLRITLRNVLKHEIERDKETLPAIRCTFELENSNLKSSIAFAGNSSIDNGWSDAPEVTGYRSDIVDSNHQKWNLLEARGISALICCEIVDRMGDRSAKWAQSNPGGVVKRLQSAPEFTGKVGERGQYWSGSMESIPPNTKTQVTVDFVPAAMNGRGRSRRNSEAEPWKWPESFEFDMEFVVGTFAAGEQPTKSKDLALRNLTIHHVILPKESKREGE